MLTATPAEGYASCCAVIERLDLTAALPRITAPTLVVHGADDPAILPSHGADIAAAVPGARLTLVRGAAHLANVEQAGAVTALIVEHLGSGT
jgi:3-oxoadipate enol-lactonase